MEKHWLLFIAPLVVSSIVPVYAEFTITSTVTAVTCPGGNDGSVSVNVSGGTPPYTYAWLPGGEITPAIIGLNAGNYDLTITDNAGIDSVVSFPVTQPAPILDNALDSTPFCTTNGYIALSPSGGTGPYQFLWNTGSIIAGLTSIGAGDYSVVVTDANNCTAGFSYTLTEGECVVTPASYFTPNGDEVNDTWSINNSDYFPEARLIVFDRWGIKVYEHRGLYERWDGKSYLGIPVPDAVYYYFFFRDKNDKQKAAKQGSVTIIR